MGGDWQGDDSIEKSLGIRSVIKKLRSQREEKNRDLAISFSNKYIVPRIETQVSRGVNSFSMELKKRMKIHLGGYNVPSTDTTYFFEILLEMLNDEGLEVRFPCPSKGKTRKLKCNKPRRGRHPHGESCIECGGEWKKMRVADIPASLKINWKF